MSWKPPEAHDQNGRQVAITQRHRDLEGLLAQVRQSWHPTPLRTPLLRQQIALCLVCPDNNAMDHRPLVTASASAPDIDDVQGSAAKRPEPTRRIRRQSPPSERHLSLTRNLQRDVWKVADPDDRARRIEDTYGLQKK
jgi:hypothetical protein